MARSCAPKHREQRRFRTKTCEDVEQCSTCAASACCTSCTAAARSARSPRRSPTAPPPSPSSSGCSSARRAPRCSSPPAGACGSPTPRSCSPPTPRSCSPPSSAPRPTWRSRPPAPSKASCASARSRPRACTCCCPRSSRCADRTPAWRCSSSRPSRRRRWRRCARTSSTSCSPTSGPATPRPRLPGLDREDLFSEAVHVAIAASHPAVAHDGPLAARRRSSETPWATGEAGGGMAELVRRVCNGSGGFEPRIRHHTNELTMLLALVARARGGHAAAGARAGRRAGRHRRAARPRRRPRPHGVHRHARRLGPPPRARRGPRRAAGIRAPSGRPADHLSLLKRQVSTTSPSCDHADADRERAAPAVLRRAPRAVDRDADPRGVAVRLGACSCRRRANAVGRRAVERRLEDRPARVRAALVAARAPADAGAVHVPVVAGADHEPRPCLVLPFQTDSAAALAGTTSARTRAASAARPAP